MDRLCINADTSIDSLSLPACVVSSASHEEGSVAEYLQTSAHGPYAYSSKLNRGESQRGALQDSNALRRYLPDMCPGRISEAHSAHRRSKPRSTSVSSGKIRTRSWVPPPSHTYEAGMLGHNSYSRCTYACEATEQRQPQARIPVEIACGAPVHAGHAKTLCASRMHLYISIWQFPHGLRLAVL